MISNREETMTSCAATITSAGGCALIVRVSTLSAKCTDNACFDCNNAASGATAPHSTMVTMFRSFEEVSVSSALATHSLAPSVPSRNTSMSLVSTRGCEITMWLCSSLAARMFHRAPIAFVMAGLFKMLINRGNTPASATRICTSMLRAARFHTPPAACRATPLFSDRRYLSSTHNTPLSTKVFCLVGLKMTSLDINNIAFSRVAGTSEVEITCTNGLVTPASKIRFRTDASWLRYSRHSKVVLSISGSFSRSKESSTGSAPASST